MAAHNAAIYGADVASRIDFICSDFFALAPQLQVMLGGAAISSTSYGLL